MQDNIFDLIKLLVDFQNVERGVTVPGTPRKENDTEHSFNLAITAWVIIEKDKLPLDLNKVLRYALVHDLVEVYAGDSFALDANLTATKEAREQEALAKLRSDYVTKELAVSIDEYEGLSEEAKFVYALDKLMPALGILYGKNTIWKDNNITPADWDKKFRDKVAVSKYAMPYFELVLEEQKANPALLA